MQLTDTIIKKLFGINIILGEDYPHGFISKNVILPAEFCTLGVIRFLNDLETFNEIKQEILLSLYNKAIELDNRDLVYPYNVIINI